MLERISRLVPKLLNSTSRVTVFAAPTTNTAYVTVAEWLNLCNTHSAPVNVTIEFYENTSTTHFPLVSVYPLPVNATLTFPMEWMLKDADAIVCTASVTNVIYAALRISELLGRPQ